MTFLVCSACSAILVWMVLFLAPLWATVRIGQKGSIFHDEQHTKWGACPRSRGAAGHHFSRFLWQTVSSPWPDKVLMEWLLFKHCKSTHIKYGTMFWNRRLRATLSLNVSHKILPWICVSSFQFFQISRAGTWLSLCETRCVAEFSFTSSFLCAGPGCEKHHFSDYL